MDEPPPKEETETLTENAVTEKETPKWQNQQEWNEVMEADSVDPKAETLSIMTYNVLAQTYILGAFPYCPSALLGAERRRELVLQQILAHSPDFLNLQEVEQDVWDFLFEKLTGEGYEGFFFKRETCKPDGCGMLFKRRRFRNMVVQKIQYNDLAVHFKARGKNKYLTNNIGIAALFQLKSSETAKHPTQFWVINTHLYWDPDKPDVKLLQMYYCLSQLKKIESNNFIKTGLPVFLCGDFNSLPISEVSRYICEGLVSKKVIHKNNLQQFASNLHHEYEFQSAYTDIGHPYTNITGKFKGCIDYIYFNPFRFELVGVLGSLEPEHYKETIALPNSNNPSDHIPLVAKFVFSSED